MRCLKEGDEWRNTSDNLNSFFNDARLISSIPFFSQNFRRGERRERMRGRAGR